MTEEQLKNGDILLNTIKTTTEAILKLKDEYDKLTFHDRTSCTPRQLDNFLDDGMYSFFISKHTDGSGFNVVLNRYGGNLQLLKVIIDELESQLKDFTEQFNNL